MQSWFKCKARGSRDRPQSPALCSNIFKARDEDYITATQRIFRSKSHPSHLEIFVIGREVPKAEVFGGYDLLHGIASSRKIRRSKPQQAEIHERSSGLFVVFVLQFLADKLRARANPCQKSAHRQQNRKSARNSKPESQNSVELHLWKRASGF